MRIKTALFVIIVLMLCLIGLAYRCVYLQYFKSDFYLETTEKQRFTTIADKPRRGMILDIKAHQLAVSNASNILFADPELIGDHKELSNKLSKIINMPAHQISSCITKPLARRYSPIKEDITAEEIEQIKAANIKGIGVETSLKRFYPNGRQTSHIVGFAGKDGNGLGGLELRYDRILRGVGGNFIFETDAARRPIRFGSLSPKIASDGTSLVLTIDTTIQDIAYNALYKQYKEYNAQAAVCIIMNPSTGAILAMISLPDFDPYEFGSTKPEVLKNRALTDTYEPGSIFKPVVVAVGLDNGSIGYNDVIFCENGYYSGKGFGSISEYNNKSYGNLSIKGILINSSNIGMAKIGQRMGNQKIYEGIKLFGFGRKTGVDLYGEDAGLLWTLESWTGYSTTRIPFGQEISVTAMQIARAYCIIANGGRVVKPHIVKAFISPDGSNVDITKTAPPSAIVIKPEVSKWLVNSALTAVVEQGTGKKAASKKWKVFGKTGTANIALKGGGGYDDQNYVASFVGGAPAEEPKIVVLVSFIRPDRSLKKGYTGGTVAAPVVGEIIEKTLTYLENTGK